MRFRCPTARLVGTGQIENYALQFRGRAQCAFATIVPRRGASVPVAIWELQAKDEKNLDRYEGFPSHYFKRMVRVQMDSGACSAMAYIMDLRMEAGLPSTYYYGTVYEGYLDCQLDPTCLEQALQESAREFYTANLPLAGKQEEIEEEDLDQEEDKLSVVSDPFYYSEGFHL